jgi:hypothetical protein
MTASTDLTVKRMMPPRNFDLDPSLQRQRQQQPPPEDLNHHVAPLQPKWHMELQDQHTALPLHQTTMRQRNFDHDLNQQQQPQPEDHNHQDAQLPQKSHTELHDQQTVPNQTPLRNFDLDHDQQQPDDHQRSSTLPPSQEDTLTQYRFRVDSDIRAALEEEFNPTKDREEEEEDSVPIQDFQSGHHSGLLNVGGATFPVDLLVLEGEEGKEISLSEVIGELGSQDAPS